ncbi:MAG: hypothetical protein ABI461_14605, partial [Polyangiaceae bacterium]
MKIRSFSACFGAIAALTAVACSSSNSGAGSASDSSSFIDQYCSYIATCCGSQSLPSDGKQCHALYSLASGTYDAQKGQACIDAVKAASSGDAAWCVDKTADTSGACEGVYAKSSGGVQPGGACKSDSDCAAAPAGSDVKCRDYYDFDTKADTEICQVETHGKAGDGPCLGTVTTQSGSTVTSYNDGGDGGTHPSTGVVCFVSEGFTCESASDKCVALAQVGDDCSSAQCVTGSHCDFTSEKCVASVATG